MKPGSLSGIYIIHGFGESVFDKSEGFLGLARKEEDLVQKLLLLVADTWDPEVTDEERDIFCPAPGNTEAPTF